MRCRVELNDLERDQTWWDGDVDIVNSEQPVFMGR